MSRAGRGAATIGPAGRRTGPTRGARIEPVIGIRSSVLPALLSIASIGPAGPDEPRVDRVAPTDAEIRSFGADVALAGEEVFAVFERAPPDADGGVGRRCVASFPVHSSGEVELDDAFDVEGESVRTITSGDEFLVVSTRSTGGEGRAFVIDTKERSRDAVPLEVDDPDSWNPADAGSFGTAVACSERRIAIAAPLESGRPSRASGRVYLFGESADGAWACEHVLQLPANLRSRGRLGESLAMSDDFLFVGAHYAGAVHWFHLDPVEPPRYGGQLTTAGAEDWGVRDNATFFGTELCASGDHLLVGSPLQLFLDLDRDGPDPDRPNGGHVFHYVYHDDGWELAHARGSEARSVEHAGFGARIALGGTRVFIAGPGRDFEPLPGMPSHAPVAGMVEGFELDRGRLLRPLWTPSLRGFPIDRPGLGRGLAARPGLLAVGSPGEGPGAVYLARLE